MITTVFYALKSMMTGIISFSIATSLQEFGIIYRYSGALLGAWCKQLMLLEEILGTMSLKRWWLWHAGIFGYLGMQRSLIIFCNVNYVGICFSLFFPTWVVA
jgi:hypothetical protein